MLADDLVDAEVAAALIAGEAAAATAASAEFEEQPLAPQRHQRDAESSEADECVCSRASLRSDADISRDQVPRRILLGPLQQPSR